jgi:hypothetical protein
MPLPVVSFSPSNGISVSILPIEVQSTSLQDNRLHAAIEPERKPEIVSKPYNTVKTSPAFAVKSVGSPVPQTKAVRPFILSETDSKNQDAVLKKEPAFSVQNLLPSFLAKQMPKYKTVPLNNQAGPQSLDASAFEHSVNSIRIPAFSVGRLDGPGSQSIYSSRLSMYQSTAYDPEQAMSPRTPRTPRSPEQYEDTRHSWNQTSPNSARKSTPRVTFAQNHLTAPSPPPATPTLSEPAYGDKAHMVELNAVAGVASSPREMEDDALSPRVPRSQEAFMAHWTGLAARRFEQHLRDAGIVLSPTQKHLEQRRFIDSIRTEAADLWRSESRLRVAGGTGGTGGVDAQPMSAIA